MTTDRDDTETGDRDDTETYTEYVDTNGIVALIHDPTNAHAWIQSDTTVAVDP